MKKGHLKNEIYIFFLRNGNGWKLTVCHSLTLKNGPFQKIEGEKFKKEKKTVDGAFWKAH